MKIIYNNYIIEEIKWPWTLAIIFNSCCDYLFIVGHNDNSGWWRTISRLRRIVCGRVFGGGVVLDFVVMNSLIGLVGLICLLILIFVFSLVVVINQANYYPYDHNHHHRIFYWCSESFWVGAFLTTPCGDVSTVIATSITTSINITTRHHAIATNNPTNPNNNIHCHNYYYHYYPSYYYISYNSYWTSSRPHTTTIMTIMTIRWCPITITQWLGFDYYLCLCYCYMWWCCCWCW